MTQITGNIGLFYVCYELSRKGWNVMPTSRNARGIDIVGYNNDGRKFIGIQVKTLSQRSPVPLGNTLEKIMGDFWIIVNNVVDSLCIYILQPKEVIKLAHRGERDGRVSYWLQPIDYEIDKFKDAWHRIGRGDK